MLTCRRAGIASGAIDWIRPRGVTRGETFGRVARVLVRASGTPEPQDRALRKTAGVNGDDPITGSLHQARGLRERLASVVDAFRPKPGASQTDDEPDEEWERWQRRFDRVDSEEGILVALQAQLEDAVAKEDFTAAASIKKTIASMRDEDPITAVERGYRAAVENEDYAAAAQFRDLGAGLVGWWAGRGATEEEPGGAYGVMMQVTAQHGRYVGVSYSAKDLAVMQERAKQRKSQRRQRLESAFSGEAAVPSDADPTGGPLAMDGSTGANSGQDRIARELELLESARVEGHRVFELWIEENEDGTRTTRAVRLDQVPIGASGEEGSNDEGGAGGSGFATTLGGFPLSGPIRTATSPQKQDPGPSDSYANVSFDEWTVVDGVVSAPGAGRDPASPFPFAIDGMSMDELVSYERRGFMKEYLKAPGFAANWARLKSEHGVREGTEGPPNEEGGTDGGFKGFGTGSVRDASEPRDEFYFDKYVINEDAGSMIDVDELIEGLEEDDDAQFDLEELREGDALTDAAMALLGGRRLNELTPEMRAEIENSLKAEGFLAEDESLHDDAELEVQIEEIDADADPWLTEEVRVPVEMAPEGRHAFTLTSDPEHGAHAPLFRSSMAAAAGLAATEAEVEAAVLKGMAEAKAALAEELRAAAKAANSDPAAKPEKGDTEVVMVNLDPDASAKFKRDVDKLRRDGEIPPSPANQWPPSPGKDKPGPQAAGADAPANPVEPPNGALSSDSVGSRLGKSKGERLFERLSAAASASAEANDAEYAESLDEEIDKMLSAKDFAAEDSLHPGEASGGGDERVDPNAPANDAERHAADAAERLFEMLNQDGDATPLPLKSRFSRIPEAVASRANVDPFDRLYLGAFGPHGPEVLRVVRGRWGDELGEGEECVTAVKLTGDANVPAGAASFRAKVGPQHKLESSFSYPEDLGVTARYKGQGRVAKPGFTERNWVDGELLVLDGRGGSLTGGAELGFVWAVPGERRLLILFSSLELPDATPPVGMYLD